MLKKLLVHFSDLSPKSIAILAVVSAFQLAIALLYIPLMLVILGALFGLWWLIWKTCGWLIRSYRQHCSTKTAGAD